MKGLKRESNESSKQSGLAKFFLECADLSRFINFPLATLAIILQFFGRACLAGIL